MLLSTDVWNRASLETIQWDVGCVWGGGRAALTHTRSYSIMEVSWKERNCSKNTGNQGMHNNLSSLHSAEIFSAQSAPRMAKADFLGLWVYVLAQPGFGRKAKNLPLLSPYLRAAHGRGKWVGEIWGKVPDGGVVKLARSRKICSSLLPLPIFGKEVFEPERKKGRRVGRPSV